MLLTEALFSSPRLGFSTAQMKAILSYTTQMGGNNVPSMYAVKKDRDRLKSLVGDPTIKQVSNTGDVYYLNDIGSAVSKASLISCAMILYVLWLIINAQDMSNPLLRPSMTFYPEDGGGASSQLWHGSKWVKEAPDDLLTPMVSVLVERGELHFYVNELVQLANKELFIPTRFLTRAKTNPPPGSKEPKPLHALGWLVSRSEVCGSIFAIVVDSWVLISGRTRGRCSQASYSRSQRLRPDVPRYCLYLWDSSILRYVS